MNGKDFSYLKKNLARCLNSDYMSDRKKIENLMNDKKFLEVVIKKGKEKASIKAEENLKKIREIVGFV